MNSDRTQTDNDFIIGAAIPGQVKSEIRQVLLSWDTAANMELYDEWQLTLVTLNQSIRIKKIEENLVAPASTLYYPTAVITHIGLRSGSDEIWAFVKMTPSLKALRTTIVQKLAQQNHTNVSESLDPHILLGRWRSKTSIRSSDKTLVISFPIRKLDLSPVKVRMKEAG